MVKQVHTLKGAFDATDFGIILPHEHIFTDLRGPNVAGYAQADPSDVVEVVAPYLKEAAASGVTALVECSTVGVGRNLSVLSRLAEVSPLHIIAPTGVYRDAYIPTSLRQAGVDDLADKWTYEITNGIEGTSIRAGFIKLAVSDDGITQLEVRNLKAAAIASQRTGAVIASHTAGGGKYAHAEMDILQGAGLDLNRFIWVHAQTEPDFSMLEKAAQRGVYVELDSVGAPYQSQPDLLETTIGLIRAGYLEKILLSHDAGWYNPAHPAGLPDDGYRGYTAMTREFLPALVERGISKEQIRRITVDNPVGAFAF